MNQQESRYEFSLRAGFVKKSRLACNDQLWNSRNVWSQHNLSPCHGFHQNKRNSFAPAGQHDYIGPVVERVHLLSLHMAEQKYSSFKT